LVTISNALTVIPVPRYGYDFIACGEYATGARPSFTSRRHVWNAPAHHTTAARRLQTTALFCAGPIQTTAVSFIEIKIAGSFIESARPQKSSLSLVHRPQGALHSIVNSANPTVVVLMVPSMPYFHGGRQALSRSRVMYGL
jgi:hypothetical protein